MQINTTSLATLKAFTQFTARATVKESDIAKIDTTRVPSKSLRITTAKGDRAWWALSRTATSRADNNEVRTAFKKAVSDIFGGEDKIPDSVKKQMKLSDYGKGRPLTPHRGVSAPLREMKYPSSELQLELILTAGPYAGSREK